MCIRDRSMATLSTLSDTRWRRGRRKRKVNWASLTRIGSSASMARGINPVSARRTGQWWIA
eukprot:672985-Rhodomonas_salina.1